MSFLVESLKSDRLTVELGAVMSGDSVVKGMGSLARIKKVSEDFKEAFVTDTLAAESLTPKHALAMEEIVDSINRMVVCKQNWTRAVKALNLEDEDDVDIVAAI